MLYAICNRVPPLMEWYWEYWYRTPMYNFFNDLDAYITNRWIHKTHLVRIHAVKKGKWIETEDMLFEAVFEILVDFVEIQAAHLIRIQVPDPEETDEIVKQWLSTGLFKRLWNRQYWNEQLGMAHLRWEASIDHHDQAEKASRILELYQWYKWERAKRPDIFDDEFSGEMYDPNWTHIQVHFGPDGEEIREEVPSMSAEYRDYCNEQRLLVERNFHEDTRRAQQVLEIRESLWT